MCSLNSSLLSLSAQPSGISPLYYVLSTICFIATTLPLLPLLLSRVLRPLLRAAPRNLHQATFSGNSGQQSVQREQEDTSEELFPDRPRSPTTPNFEETDASNVTPNNVLAAAGFTPQQLQALLLFVQAQTPPAESANQFAPTTATQPETNLVGQRRSRDEPTELPERTERKFTPDKEFVQIQAGENGKFARFHPQLIKDFDANLLSPTYKEVASTLIELAFNYPQSFKKLTKGAFRDNADPYLPNTAVDLARYIFSLHKNFPHAPLFSLETVKRSPTGLKLNEAQVTYLRERFHKVITAHHDSTKAQLTKSSRDHESRVCQLRKEQKLKWAQHDSLIEKEQIASKDDRLRAELYDKTTQDVCPTLQGRIKRARTN